MIARVAIALSALCTVMLASPPETPAAESRGLTIRMKPPGGDGTHHMQLYRASHALVIGIDDYTRGWPQLDMAVADARAVARALERHGFQVTLRSNLDSASLDHALKEFFAIRGADPDARLFLWYAGHGHTIGDEGFLVPSDAPPASDPTFKVKAIHLRDFGGLVRLAEAKHVLSIFDSCFSGTVFTSRSAPTPAGIGLKTIKPVRQFLTSGTAGQRVRDDGSFRELFLRALAGEGRADANQDGYVTGDELGLYLSQEMTRLTDTAQTPQWGRLQDVRFNEGDFVFETKPSGETVPPVAHEPDAPEKQHDSPEIVFWKSIRDSEDPADFEAYLDNFPTGLFADLARIRLARLRPPIRETLAPPPGYYDIQPIEATFVAIDNVNLRAEPTVESRRLGTVHRDAGIVVTGRVLGRSWYRMRLPDGTPAFVHSDFLKRIDPAELIAWYRAKQTDDPNAYRRFIHRFPDGHYHRQAEHIARALERARNDAAVRRPLEEWRLRENRFAGNRRERQMLNDLVRFFGHMGH